MTRVDPDALWSPAARAQLALLLEVAGTPKPGNVDRHREFDDLRFEHFLAGAVGAGPGLRAAERGEAVGAAFERAVAGMSAQSGGNTQFGCLLLLVPLVRAAGAGEGALTPAAATRVVEATTVDDAAAFYRAFDHVDVAVADPPAGWDALDVRRGADAVPALRERGTTLYDVMAGSAPADGNAAEWVGGFERAFRVADRVAADEGSLADRAARAFLAELAAEPDTLVAVEHGASTAAWLRDRAADLANAPRADVSALGDELVGRGINPGTTADAVAAGLYAALERGVAV